MNSGNCDNFLFYDDSEKLNTANLKQELNRTNIPAIDNLSNQTSKFKKSIMNAQFSWDEWEDYMRAFVRGTTIKKNKESLEE